MHTYIIKFGFFLFFVNLFQPKEHIRRVEENVFLPHSWSFEHTLLRYLVGLALLTLKLLQQKDPRASSMPIKVRVLAKSDTQIYWQSRVEEECPFFPFLNLD